MSQQEETNSATIRALTEVTEAVKRSIDIEADGRNQAVVDLKTTFVGVHEETMTELGKVNDGVTDIKKTVTDDLSEMKTTLNGIRERLPDVADKQDVKVILDMLDAQEPTFRVFKGDTANNTMHVIAFGEEQFCEIAAVHSGNTSNKCFTHG